MLAHAEEAIAAGQAQLKKAAERERAEQTRGSRLLCRDGRAGAAEGVAFRRPAQIDSLKYV